MSWRRLLSVVVTVCLAGLLVAACTSLSPGGTQFQIITVKMAATGPGVVQGTDPDNGKLYVCDLPPPTPPETPRGPPCDFDFADAGLGGSIEVTAVPGAGYVLQSWTTGCPGSTFLSCILSFSAGPDDTLLVAATFGPPIGAITFSDDFNSDCDKWVATDLGGTAMRTNSEFCHDIGGISHSGYLEMTHEFGMGSMSVEHAFTGDSLVVGLESGGTCAATVRFEEHRIITTAAFTGAAVGAWVWIKQDGVRYNGPTSTFKFLGWVGYNSQELTAADFSPGLDLCPVTNSTLTFGFARSNSTNGAPTITMVHGIDDWSVTIVPGPLPTP